MRYRQAKKIARNRQLNYRLGTLFKVREVMRRKVSKAARRTTAAYRELARAARGTTRSIDSLRESLKELLPESVDEQSEKNRHANLKTLGVIA